jgi:hypothetical protein
MCAVILKRFFLLSPFLAIATVFSASLPVCAQVVQSANKQQFAVTVGAMGSAFQPDYSLSTGVSRNADYLFGTGTYVDVTLNRWLQLEAESRWLRFNSAESDNEDNYQAGFRVPLKRYGRVTPYAKALAGMARGNFLDGNALMFTVGGGVEYKLNKRFSLRAADFEYQVWRTTPTLEPYGFSVGIGYKIF